MRKAFGPGPEVEAVIARLGRNHGLKGLLEELHPNAFSKALDN